MMADVQLEHGYTKIANELLEVLARTPLNATQLRIILVLWRYTYGYNRKEHELSESFLSKATGISKRYISKEINKLVKYGILKIVRESSYTSPRVYTFSKDYDSWKCRTIVQQVSNDSTVEQKQDTTVEQLFNTTVEQSFHQEINNINKNIKKMSIDDFFEQLWSLYPRKRGKGQVSKTQKEKLYRIGLDELTRAIERYKQEIAGTDARYVMYGSTFFNSGYLDYLDIAYKDKDEPKPNAEYLRLKEMVNGGQSTGI